MFKFSPSAIRLWLVVMGAVVMGLGSCQPQEVADGEIRDLGVPDSMERQVDQGLALNNATLEQSDQDGNLLWKIKVDRVVYTENNQVAALEQVVANIYDEEGLLFKVSADRGQVEEEGTLIKLEQNVLVNDVRQGSTLQSDRGQWSTNDRILDAEGNVKIYHPQISLTATKGKYFTKQNNVELTDKVYGMLPEESVKLNSDHLVWQITPNKVVSDRPITITTKDGIATAKQGDMLLDREVINLAQEVRWTKPDNKQQLATDQASYFLKSQTIQISAPLRFRLTEENVELTANQGEFSIKDNMIRLRDGVRGVDQTQQAEIYAQTMNWNLTTEELIANTNVTYSQKNPDMTFKGDSATGNLRNRAIVVRGGVETMIVPQ